MQLLQEIQQQAELMLIESVLETMPELVWLFEEGEIEWEAQPKFKGVKGTSRESGFGMKQRKAGKKTVTVNQIKQQYKLVRANLIAAEKDQDLTLIKSLRYAKGKIEQFAAKNKIALPAE